MENFYLPVINKGLVSCERVLRLGLSAVTCSSVLSARKEKEKLVIGAFVHYAFVFPLKCSTLTLQFQVSPNKVTKLLDNGHPREAVFSHSKGHLRGFKANKNVQVVCIKVNMVLIQQKRASIRLY